MELSELLSSDFTKKVLESDVAKKALASAKTHITKVAKDYGIDLKDIISFAMNNKSVIAALVNIGKKKDSDVSSTTVQKLVGTLKSALIKATKTEVENDDFGKIVTGLLGNKEIKSNVEKIAGSGVSTFIKKAVAAYISN